MIDINNDLIYLTKVKQKIIQLDRDKIELESEIKIMMKLLKEEFNISSIKEAEELLKELIKDKNKLEETMQKQLKEIKQILSKI